MGSNFMNQFLIGWRMGQDRIANQRSAEQEAYQRQQDEYRRQQDVEDRQIKMNEYKLAMDEYKLKMKALQHENTLKDIEARRQASALQGMLPSLPQPTAADVGPAEQDKLYLEFGGPPQETKIPQPSMNVPALAGGPDIPMPIPTGRQQQVLTQQAQQSELEKIYQKELARAQAQAKAKPAASERPFVVGGKLVSPTGQVIYGGGGGDGGGISAGMGEDALKGLSPQDANLVKQIASYQIDPTKVASLRGDQRERLIKAVVAYDPTYDMREFPVRSALRKDFTSGKGAINIRALNTAVAHLGDLADASAKLPQGDFPILNKLALTATKQTGGDAVKKWEAASTGVESELAAVFKGTGATDQEIKAWRQQFSAADSPAQRKAAIDTAVKLMIGRMGALQDQYGKVMGKDLKILSDKSIKTLERIGIDPAELGLGGESDAPPQGASGAGTADNPYRF